MDSGLDLTSMVVGGLIAIVTSCTSQFFQWLQQLSENRRRLRQEVYVAASEGLNDCYKFIGGLGRTDISDDQLVQMLSNAQIWSQKMRMIAKQPAIEALDAAFTAFTKHSARMMRVRFNMSQVLAKMHTLEAQYKQREQFVGQAWAYVEQTKHRGGNAEFQKAFETFDPLVMQAKSEAEQFQVAHAASQRELIECQRQLVSMGQLATREFQQNLRSVFVFLRREMGIRTDAVNFMKTLEQSQMATVQDLNDLFDHMSKDSQGDTPTGDKSSV